MIDKSDWIHLPHAAHHICGSRCAFKLATVVGSVIVSTVGELRFTHDGPYEVMGTDCNYETMVFHCKPDSAIPCCGFSPADDPLECDRYVIAGDAVRGHWAACEKWAHLPQDMHALATYASKCDTAIDRAIAELRATRHTPATNVVDSSSCAAKALEILEAAK